MTVISFVRFLCWGKLWILRTHAGWVRSKFQSKSKSQCIHSSLLWINKSSSHTKLSASCLLLAVNARRCRIFVDGKVVCVLCFFAESSREWNHPSIIWTTCPLRVTQGAGANPSWHWARDGVYVLDRSPAYHRADIQRLITIHPHVHTYGRFRVSNWTSLNPHGRRRTQRKPTHTQGEHATPLPAPPGIRTTTPLAVRWHDVIFSYRLWYMCIIMSEDLTCKWVTQAPWVLVYFFRHKQTRGINDFTCFHSKLTRPPKDNPFKLLDFLWPNPLQTLPLMGTQEQKYTQVFRH